MPIIKFHSKNCDSCLKMLPMVDKIKELYHQNQVELEINSIDTLDSNNQQILDKYQIVKKQTVLPVLVFIDNKDSEISRLSGKIQTADLIKNIDKLLETQEINSPSKNFDLEQNSSRKDIAEFVEKANQIKKDNPLDLSSDEDLSIAIMNLISIEEHLFFTANKTGNTAYYEILKEVREIRKRSLKMIIKEYEGEVWCISKHLLAASMRLMEVGTKQLGREKQDLAYSLFADSYRMYLLFWGLNMNLIKSDKILDNQDDLAKTFQENVDCCKE